MNISTCIARHTPLVASSEVDFEEITRALTRARWGGIGVTSASKAEVRSSRLQQLEQLPRLYQHCETEDPGDAIDEWTQTLSLFETEELLEILDYAIASAEEAWDAERPFHFSACLCGLLMEWSHDELSWMESQPESSSQAEGRLTSIFDAAFAYFVSLRQEADVLSVQARGELLRAA